MAALLGNCRFPFIRTAGTQGMNAEDREQDANDQRDIEFRQPVGNRHAEHHGQCLEQGEGDREGALGYEGFVVSKRTSKGAAVFMNSPG